MSGPLNGALNGAGVPATVALPFEPPRVVSIEIGEGKSLAEIVDAALAEGFVPRELESYLAVYLNDEDIARALWPLTRPREGDIVSLRVRPGLAAVVQFVWNAVVNIAVAATVNAVLKAFTPDPADPLAQEQVYDLKASSNEMTPYAPVQVVLGKMRVWPKHAAKAYTVARGEKVYLRMLLSWGLGPLSLDAASLKIGDTALAGFTGVTVQHRLTPSAAWPTIFPSSADEVAGPGLVAFADGWVQRTTALDAEELNVEILFPEGLIRIKSDGGTDSVGVGWRVRYRAVGTTTWLGFATGAAASEGSPYSKNARTQKPFRETHVRLVAKGQYEVAVKRETEDYDNPNIRTKINWTILRSFTFEKAVNDDNLAVTAIEIEAGEQLNGQVDLFNGVVTRLAPIWNAGTETWGAAAATQNPAELVRWIATGPGAARPRVGGADLDDAAFGAWAELCTARGWRCDMELRAGAGLDEVQQTVAKCGRAVLGERAGKLVPVIDDTQAAATQLFTPRNSWGFRVARAYPRETHALRLEFNNEEKAYAKDEMVVYFDGYTLANAELIETLPTAGKTRPVEVFREGRRAAAERILRQEEFSWRADIENLATARGQRVALAHFVMAVGRKAARVKARVLNVPGTHVTGLQLDEVVTQTTGDTYGLRWRKVAGAAISVESLALTNTGVETDTLTLAAVGGLPLASAPAVGDLVEFGDGGIETLDVVVQEITRAGAFEAELRGLLYTGSLWGDDATALPTWSSNVSSATFPRPPAPVWVSVAPGPDGIFARYDFPTDGVELVEAVEAYWRPAEDDGEAFTLVARAPKQQRVVQFPTGEGGKSYVLRLVAVGARDTRTASTEQTVVSQAVASTLTLIRSSALSQRGRTLRKESGTAGWNAQAYSAESYVGAAYATGQPAQTNANLAFGFTTDPVADANFTSIDFCWVLESDGTCKATENGVSVWDTGATYAATDVFSIVYDNASVKYLKNGVVEHDHATTLNLKLSFDSAFDTIGGELYGVGFGPSGSTPSKQETRYKRSTAPPSTPTGDSPGDWSTSIPIGASTLWASSALKTDAGALIGAWSTPARLSRPNDRGDYAAGATYYLWDSVRLSGGTYECKVDSTTGNSPSGTAEENAWWSVLAAPGSAGEPGTPPSAFTATIDLTTTSSGVNLRTLADANGYTGASNATITFEVESGVIVTGLAGAPSGGLAIDSGTWPTSSYTIALTLTVKSGGIVRGGGGRGGSGALATGAPGGNGGDGGDAVYCRLPMTININAGSEVRAGGGAGGAGGTNFLTGTGVYYGGQGGGGGAPNGAGGSAGTLNTNPQAGANGTTSGGGAGGAANGTLNFAGGNGGSYGVAGAAGSTPTGPGDTAGGTGGAAGYCVRKNGHTVTVTNSGTTAGTIG